MLLSWLVFLVSFLLFMHANIHIPQEGNSETIQISYSETRAYTLLVNKVIVVSHNLFIRCPFILEQFKERSTT